MSDNKTWGIHMGAHVGTDPVDNSHVAIGWQAMGDLCLLPNDRDLIKQKLSEVHPEAKQGTIRVWAGNLHRFLFQVKAGDYIVYPSKTDRMINIGRATGKRSYVENDEHDYPNRLHVEWLGHFPRDRFSQAALYECGSALTIFQIKNYTNEILSAIDVAETQIDDQEEDSEDDETVATEASNKALEVTTDFIIKQLKSGMDAYQFEHFVAHLLECMKYFTRVTQGSGDGGVDIIAHRDELGFEPPIIKVQCKQVTDKIGDPVINQLLGTLGEGEFGLVVCLGSYTTQAKATERNKPKLRLIDGEQLVEMVLENYSELAPKYRALIPLKQIYVADL